MAWRRSQDREQWQRTVETAMLQHGPVPDDDRDDDDNDDDDDH